MNKIIINDYLASNFSNTLLEFERLVKINSYTLNVEGVNKQGEATSKLFSNLGFSSQFIKSENNSFGNHLIMTRKGISEKSILLVSHLDTVFTETEERNNNFKWRDLGEKIIGPGTIDIKGGTIAIYMMLCALKELAKEHFDKINWVVALNSSEEMGATDLAKHINKKENILACLVFECDYKSKNNSYTLVNSRKGLGIFKLNVHGRSSHSGVNHQQGVSAIRQIAELITLIESKTDYEKGITFNVGTIKGGNASNRVPDYSCAEIEVRALCPEIFKGGINFINELPNYAKLKSVEDQHKASAVIEEIYIIQPWQKNTKTSELFKFWQDAGKKIGLEVYSESRGGRSDGNLFYLEIPTIDGLGPVGNFDHCSYQSEDGTRQQEYVVKESLITKSVINTLAVSDLISKYT